MKDNETTARFICLRAQGWTFDRISTELNVSKPTLINWSRQHQFEIQNLRAIETEALARKLFASRQQRWEKLALDLQRVEEELAKRDLAELPTGQLLNQAARLRAEVTREVGEIRFSTPTRHIPNDEYFENVLDWQV